MLCRRRKCKMNFPPLTVAASPPKRVKKSSENNYTRVHDYSESLITSSTFDNFKGFLNLGFVLLILSNFRVALDNVLKYGLLIDPVQVTTIFLEDPYRWPSASLVIFSNVFIQVSFFTEKLLASGKISERFGRCVHIFFLLTMLIVACTVVLVFQPPPWAALIAVMWYTTVWLKMVSYISVNLWHRSGLMKQPEKDGHIANGKHETACLVVYPNNLTQRDLYYFVFAPTLCYELNFPRNARIRKRFLIRRIIEFIFLVGIVIGAIQQWIVPTVKNSWKPIQDMDLARGLERVMKLAVPNHLIWLLFFYATFHSGLNIVAEVLKFGDRTFYRDWWNAPNIAYFWQAWNIPVHRWARRHLYTPMLKSGYTSIQAQIAVFLLSALFHEFLVSVPLRLFRFWAFLAMLSQVPLHIFGKYFLKDYPNYGNVLVWVSIILGQPLAILCYFHDFYVSNGQ
ncbi:diacylglycerol O-acyltransferase 1-like isoform X1 [Oculina patagonica]